MATVLQSQTAMCEQSHQKGDRYALTLSATGIDFSDFTCTASLYDSRRQEVLVMDVDISNGGEAATISAAGEDMDLKEGNYFLQFKIDDGGGDVRTLLYVKLSIFDKPVW